MLSIRFIIYALPFRLTSSFVNSAYGIVHRPIGLFSTARTVTGDVSDALEHQRPISEHQQDPTGLYVHIPYCRRRCRYCNFAIVPIGGNSVTESSSFALEESTLDRATRGFLAMDEMYVHAILKELQIISKSSRAYNQTSIGLGSIYFGGGTPSLAPIESIEKILEHVLNDDSPFYLLENAEITIEMDPGTFSLEKLQSLKQVGFNRISLGVQSFDDDILASIGRVHRRQDIFNSLAMIREVFGDTANYSLDIISGLPGLTLDKWTETLECATKLIPKPMHLSLYDLQIEQGTVFDKWYKNNGDELSSIPNKAPVTTSVVPPFLPTPEDCAFMYKYAAGYLKSKCYEHYEISSYAYLAGQSSPSPYRSRHNQIYWTPKGQWYAIGLGSTSSIAGKSLARPRLMSDYIDWVEHQEQCETPEWLPGGDDDEAGTAATRFERFTDLIMTRLRTSDGLDLSRVKESYINGEGLVLAILKGANLGLELGLVQQFRSPNGSEMLRLVDPNGFLYSNTIISNIFFELEALKVECFVDLSVARQSQAIVGESSDVAKQIPF